MMEQQEPQEPQEQVADLTDFLTGAVDRTTRPRFNRWGGEIVIDGNGQVRFHQKVLHALGELPTEPRVLVASPDDKTVVFKFISTEYAESQEFRTACKGKDIYPYTFTAGKNGCQARRALEDTRVKEIVETIVYYKSTTSKGVKYPDTLTFTDPVVDAEQKTVKISTDDIEQKLPKDGG